MAPSPSPSIVELRQLCFGYDERPVLRDVSMHIPKGRVTALIGPMSAGKTTTLRMMGGQYRGQSGQVLFDGQDVTLMDQRQLYAMRRRMGMLFQFGALFADISVFDNVAFPLREHTELPEPLIRDIVLMKLHAVGLRGARDLMPSALSGGMTRRVALARAIALDPDLVLYDEPFSGLDPISLHTVARLIRQLNDSMGLSTVLVSHELDQTLEIADHVIVLAEGQVMAQGSPREMLECRDELVHQYIHSLPDGPVRFHYPRRPIEEELGPRAPTLT